MVVGSDAALNRLYFDSLGPVKAAAVAKARAEDAPDAPDAPEAAVAAEKEAAEAAEKEAAEAAEKEAADDGNLAAKRSAEETDALNEMRCVMVREEGNLSIERANLEVAEARAKVVTVSAKVTGIQTRYEIASGSAGKRTRME
jgi:hypothetical protein